MLEIKRRQRIRRLRDDAQARLERVQKEQPGNTRLINLAVELYNHWQVKAEEGGTK